ncbi:MAG TPA: DUF4124 domain-containing protein [Gammaproteobacteria bacterium]|nr:DUF4124 domain-containing protein [Gammaproteobacteria bacterium]
MTIMRVVGGSLLMLWAATAVADTELYKWVDKDGVVHFSDKPTAGAEKIKVKDVDTIPADKPEKAGASPQPSEARHYEVTFISPKGDEAIRENEGNVDISVQLNPPLNAGDTIQFSMDGQPQGDPGGATEMSLTNVDRGTHTVEATVRDPGGKTLGSASTTFTLQRFSLLNKPPKKK